MFFLKLLIKLLLLPVSFLLFFLQLVVDTAMRLSEFFLGLLLNLLIFAIIYEVCIKNWDGLIIALVLGASVVAIAFVGVMISETCRSIREKIMML